MATVELPTLFDGTPHYEVRTRLDDEDYIFTFRYGARRRCWVFDMTTLNGTPLVHGQMVTVGTDLLQGVSNALRPTGTLYAINESPPEGGDRLTRPGLYDLGSNTKLWYTESEDG